MSNDGANYFPAGVPQPPKPRAKPTLMGSWSDPYFPADVGQERNAFEGAREIRKYYKSKKGGVLGVDPEGLGMEGGIDIHHQIQNSIDRGGYMRGVLDQALKSGQAVAFDSGKWGAAAGQSSDKRFNHGSYTADGETVGRWGGFVQGTLKATPDGKWSVNAGLWPQKQGQYDPKTQDADNPIDNAAIGLDGLISQDGEPFFINFNRVYNFQAQGDHGG